MPRAPRFIHPLRSVRTCLGYTQPAFSKVIGCSAVAIQRIENGSLKMSRELAHTISEATGADAESLRSGRKALDMRGEPYTKESYDFHKDVIPVTDDELHYLFQSLVSYVQLLLIASHHGVRPRTRAVFAEMQDFIDKLAKKHDLTALVRKFLVERGRVRKRIYRVSDLRKFREYADIIGYKEDRRYRPDKLVEFQIPHGWIGNYLLHESPVLPHGADRKLRDAEYILDCDRYIPEHIKEAIDQALYWEIKEFRLL